MLEIGNTIVGLDVLSEFFLCDISKCKGICCYEGDSGAPVEDDEKQQIEEALPFIREYLTDKAIEILDRQGATYIDEEGDLVTSIVDGKECIFTYKQNGVWMCAFEKAFNEGKIPFRKPVSCHLYPIRLRKFRKFTAVEYHRWDVCSEACKLGKINKLPIYKFLKEPLIRKFGAEWYAELEEAAEAYLQSDYAKRK